MADELPKVKLSRATIDFEQDCIDPVAKLIVVEALQYAIEKANSRLTSIGKIFTTVEDSGIKTLAVVNEIKNQINSYPSCKLNAKAEPLLASFTAAPVNLPEKMTRKTIEATVKKAEKQAELTSTGKPMEVKPLPKTVPGPRSQPARWQNVEVVNEKGEVIGKYDSPGEAATKLGLLTTGAKDMIKVFTRAGFEVAGNGEPKKGVGRFVIKPTGKPIPEQYKLLAKPESKEDVEAKAEKAVKASSPTTLVIRRLIPIRKEDKGKIVTIAYDVEDPKTGLSVEGARMTLEEGEALLATKKARL